MILPIILNFLGITIYYLNRFENRGDKSRFNLAFWLKDNLIGLIIILLLDLSFMILLLHPETSDIFGRWVNTTVPIGVVAKPFLAFLLGLGLTGGLYELIKKKITIK